MRHGPQAGLFNHLQVVGHGRLRDREPSGQVPARVLLRSGNLQEVPEPRAVGESLRDLQELSLVHASSLGEE